MSKFFSKINIPTPRDVTNTFDLSSDHVTTMDFFLPKISYFRHLNEGETLNVNMETFCRMHPLSVPTFGRFNIIHKAYFVPSRLCWSEFNDFKVSSVNAFGVVSSTVPYVNQFTLARAIVLSPDLCVQVSGGSPFDISFYSSESTNIQYKLTAQGRRVIDLLNTLGIRCSFHYSDLEKINILPLIAFWKVLQDWYFNQQYETNRTCDDWCRSNLRNSSTSIGINQTATRTLLLEISKFKGLYEQDYFTSAWDNPNAPNNSAPLPNFGIPNVVSDDYGKVEVTDAYGAHEVTLTNNGSKLNQYALDALKHFTDYLKRFQLSGSQPLNRFMARFGAVPESIIINRPIFLGKSRTQIQIGDVMATAGTDTNKLGDYAGKGLAYSSDGHFKYSTKEDGYVLIISQLYPKIGYVEGLSRHSLCLTPSDYYVREFDALGTQAIALKELFCSMDAAENVDFYQANYERVFGFTSRYAHEKVGKDVLSGDYMFKSINAGENSWYGFRLITPDYDYNHAGKRFVDSAYDGSQYYRVFNSEYQGVCPFRVIFHFDIKLTAPMSQLYDGYEFCENGKRVSMQINGTNNNGD